MPLSSYTLVIWIGGFMSGWGAKQLYIILNAQ